jgi:hypothetical protein
MPYDDGSAVSGNSREDVTDFLNQWHPFRTDVNPDVNATCVHRVCSERRKSASYNPRSPTFLERRFSLPVVLNCSEGDFESERPIAESSTDLLTSGEKKCVLPALHVHYVTSEPVRLTTPSGQLIDYTVESFVF